MQIKMAKVLNLNPIYQKIKAQVIPVKTAYKFSKLFSVLDKEAHFYSEELNKLIMEYAERDETGAPKMIDNGTGVQLQKEYIKLVQEKCNELWNLDVDVPDVNFTLEELDKLELSIEEFDLLFPFITE